MTRMTLMEEKTVKDRIKTNYGDWIDQFGETWKSQCEKLKTKFAESIVRIDHPEEVATDIPIVIVQISALKEVLGYLKTEPGFEYTILTDYTATDEMPRTPRFDLVIQLFSMNSRSRIRIKAAVAEDQEIPTLIPLWRGANWCERELWDMFGIRFKDHPDLRRILMDIRWKGHPLRKDYDLKDYQIYPTPEPVDESLLK